MYGENAFPGEYRGAKGITYLTFDETDEVTGVHMLVDDLPTGTVDVTVGPDEATYLVLLKQTSRGRKIEFQGDHVAPAITRASANVTGWAGPAHRRVHR